MSYNDKKLSPQEETIEFDESVCSAEFGGFGCIAAVRDQEE